MPLSTPLGQSRLRMAKQASRAPILQIKPVSSQEGMRQGVQPLTPDWLTLTLGNDLNFYQALKITMGVELENAIQI